MLEGRMDRRRFLQLASASVGLGYAARGRPLVAYAAPPPALPWQPGAAKLAGGQLLFQGAPFSVRGVVYQPTPIGQDPGVNDGSFSAYTDPAIRRRDFPLLRNLHANTLRIYQAQDMPLEFFRDALAAGFYVILGFQVDMRYDFTAGWARRELIEQFRQFVRAWRGQPSILMWAIGNGGNGELRRTGRADQLKAWHSLADEMARAAHEEERGQGRPVVLVSSESADIGVPALGSDDAALPNLDLWGVNAYRGRSFGSLFDELKTSKPALITEYGVDLRRHGTIPELDQVPRAHAIVNLWNEIGSRPDKAIGGCVFEFTDEWWRAQPGRADWHEWGGAENAAFPDGVANLEWFGLYGVTPGSHGPDRLQARPVVRYLTHAWSPMVNTGQPAVWFDVPLAGDAVDAQQQVSGRYSGLQSGWEIFVTVTPQGSGTPIVQPKSCLVRAASGSWVVPANLGPDRPLPGMQWALATLVAKTPAASAALRECARSGAPLPTDGILTTQAPVRIRRR